IYIRLMLLQAPSAACPITHVDTFQDHFSFIDALRGKNLLVDISVTVSKPFLIPQSRTAVRLSAGSLTTPADLQLFEYGSSTAASADAKRISPDGSGTPTTRISWTAPPHFFLKGRVLTLYLGRASGLLG